MGAHSAAWLTPERRAWAYDIARALAACLAALGLVATDTMQVVLLLVAAILGFGGNTLAARHVSPGPRDGNPNPEG